METLRLKPKQAVEDPVENWDDDDFMIEDDDLVFRSPSAAAQATTHRRDSHSSFRSDFESVHAEEEQQVVLPGDDEKSMMDAISLAASAGIPLPKNVPPSALTGGTIKRLGGRKIKRIFQDDWGDDLEFPDDPQPLHVKPQDGSKFPDILRQVSSGSTQASPMMSTKPNPRLVHQDLASATRSSDATPVAINLDLFRDTDEDGDFFGDGAATIKAAKVRQVPKPVSMITPPTPQKQDVTAADDDFEQDLELPSNGKLMLSKRKDIPKTPSMNALDDFEWGEGSLGTRFGGTRRDGRSNRSSSASALSPSVSSSITAESEGEDDTFDGLVLPMGPVNFGERLNRRRDSRSPQRIAECKEPQPSQSQSNPPRSSPEAPISALGIFAPEPSRQQQPQESSHQQQPHQQPGADIEDPWDGLELGDGDVFDANKLTLHRNIRLKDARPASPSRPKAAVSITFTSKSSSVMSRLPRPLVSHERTHTSSSLEPVSESGGPIHKLSRRSQSRIGHSAQSSVSSIPTPTTPVSAQSMPPPSTPRRREVVQKTSAISLRNEPTTTNAQLLRLKRSLPVLRQAQSPASRPVTSRGYERPPSRTDATSRPQSAMRPKTPVEKYRPAVESAAAQARKNPLPFLPAGASQSQSHHVTAKSSRIFRRHDSDTSVDLRPTSRAVSRSTMHSPSPTKKYVAHAQEGSWQQLSRPRRQRQFGDGHELDGFDDLPTSAQVEARYTRTPVAASAKAPIRNKIYQTILPDRTNTPSPLGLLSPARLDNLPHFARDTAASRIAREASLAQRAPTGPLAPLTAQRVAHLSTRNNYSGPQTPREAVRAKKTTRRPPQLKPHLIANLGGAKESRAVNGMLYNPVSMRWEGNENALSAFEPSLPSPSMSSNPSYTLREKEGSTPRPALITPIGATKGVQVVGGMVFDPQNMCWLKLGPQGNSQTEGDDGLDCLDGMDSDEDVFKDIPDLDEVVDANEVGTGRVSDAKDDWLVGEEFDVGPEFVRRQREEEQRWRKKSERWMTFEDRDQNSWRWLLRDMVARPM